MPIVLAGEDGSYVEPHKTASARLVILSGELDPDEISGLVGLSPDRSAMRGDQMRGPRRYPYHSWQLESGLSETANPEDHLDALLERLAPAASAIGTLVVHPQIHSVRVWLGLHIDNANPGLSLSDSHIRRLALIGTGVEIDVYVDGEVEPALTAGDITER